MNRHLVAGALLLLAAPLAQAQEAPERLLSANTHVYFRWDGTAGHQAAFDKSALGQVFQGDTGKLLASYLTEVKADYLLKLLRATAAEGVVVGIEVLHVDADNPPSVQLTIILPNAKTQWEPLFGTLTWMADQSGVDLKEMEVQKRTVYYFKGGPPTLAFWKEGNDAVLVFAGGDTAAAVKRVLATTPRLTSSPLLKKVQDFKEFKTSARGFVDVPGLTKLIGKVDAQAPPVLEALGLNGIKDVTFHSGFDGAATRTVVLAELPGPRKGLARLAGGAPLKLGDLPLLPADLIGFTALRMDAGALFDGAIEMLEKALPPNEAQLIKPGIDTANQALGIDIRKDLIGSLGSVVVSCAAPPDGALIFGQTLLVQVKDEKQFGEAFDKTLKSLAVIANGKMRLKQRDYRGVKLNTIYIGERGFPFMPTYAVHKGWLVLGMTPQPVQGHVLRVNGDLPAWKPGADVQAALAKLPAEHNLISVSDPRPVFKLALSAAPLFGQGIFSEMMRNREVVEFPLTPNADEFIKPLFPNVAVAVDDGKTWRLESRSSLDMPFGLGRLETGSIFMLMGVWVADSGGLRLDVAPEAKQRGE